MARTRRRDAFDNYSTPKTMIRVKLEEDEDTDPRSYNVIQRSDQERDSFRVEEAISDDS